MSDFDRKLVGLISDLTDEGQVGPLRAIVDDYGTRLTGRVIRDGFAVVADEDRIYDGPFVPTDDALALLEARSIPKDHVIRQAPGPIGLEDEPNLIFRYAPDDPEAITEVRSRHQRTI